MLSGQYRAITIIAVGLLCLPLAGTSARTWEKSNAMTRQFIQQKMREQRIPAAQVAIVKGDRIVLSESHGLANVENHVHATNATLFPINSPTKSFTGVAMMPLAEAGLVDLDAPRSRAI